MLFICILLPGGDWGEVGGDDDVLEVGVGVGGEAKKGPANNDNGGWWESWSCGGYFGGILWLWGCTAYRVDLTVIPQWVHPKDDAVQLLLAMWWGFLFLVVVGVLELLGLV